MRLQPPESNKEYFSWNEFEQYLLGHMVIGDERPFSIKVLLISEANKGSIEKAVDDVCKMLPIDYQEDGKMIFTRFLKEVQPNYNGSDRDI